MARLPSHVGSEELAFTRGVCGGSLIPKGSTYTQTHFLDLSLATSVCTIDAGWVYTVFCSFLFRRTALHSYDPYGLPSLL
jgi:hypothetical protein